MYTRVNNDINKIWNNYNNENIIPFLFVMNM